MNRHIMKKFSYLTGLFLTNAEHIVWIFLPIVICPLPQTLLRIIIDSELKFDTHVKNICNKANLNLQALSRISTFMPSDKLKTIMKAFILSQFNYCPLVWMFHSRECNNHINRIHERALRIVYSDRTSVNRIHERALRIVYSDRTSTFVKLLNNDGSVTIHHRNIQLLATEIYKFLNGLSPGIMGNIFQLSEHNYTIPPDVSFRSNNINTVHYGQLSLSYLAPRIRKLVPDNIKNNPTIQCFKLKIKRWVPYSCPCRLCKKYIPNIGFI